MKRVAQTQNPYFSFIFWSLTLSGFVVAILYMYFIHATINNVVARKDTEKTLRILRTEILELESEYFAKSQELTQPEALSSGFVAVGKSNTYFVHASKNNTLTFGKDIR